MAEDAEGRKRHARKASVVAAKRRSERARPFAVGVAAAYGFLRFGKPRKAGLGFLVERDWCPEFDFEIGCDHSTAINTLAAVTGKTKTHIRQIIKKRRPGAESHLTLDVVEQARKRAQPSLLDSLA